MSTTLFLNRAATANKNSGSVSTISLTPNISHTSPYPYLTRVFGFPGSDNSLVLYPVPSGRHYSRLGLMFDHRQDEPSVHCREFERKTPGVHRIDNVRPSLWVSGPSVGRWRGYTRRSFYRCFCNLGARNLSFLMDKWTRVIHHAPCVTGSPLRISPIHRMKFD